MTSLTKTHNPSALVAGTHAPEAALSRTPFQDAMTPRTREEAWAWCQGVARENWVPNSFRGQPMLVAIAVSFGERFGIDPMMSIQNIAVINGKPSMYGDMLLAICRKDPEFEDYTEEYHTDKVGCTVTVKRKGKAPVVETFAEPDARKANLWGKKGPWTEYPKRMCMWRARGFALRTAFPDRLAGIITREEAMDFPTVDHRGQPAPAVTGPVQDASPQPEPEPVDQAKVDHAQGMLESAQSWAQLAEAGALLKELKLPDGAQRAACTKTYNEAHARLVARHRELFKGCESRAEWLKIAEEYKQAPEAVRADMLPEYNAAEARVAKLVQEEDAKWQDDKPAQTDEPPEDDVPY